MSKLDRVERRWPIRRERRKSDRARRVEKWRVAGTAFAERREEWPERICGTGEGTGGAGADSDHRGKWSLSGGGGIGRILEELKSWKGLYRGDSERSLGVGGILL